jgi:tripartite-type tricarboxylate transporter receptor subunit TctC
MRSTIKLIAGVTLSVFALGILPAAAASYPDHPVKIVVPFAPAGPTDVMARLIAQKLSDSLKQQFYIENHPGAGGNIGMTQVAKSPPDGYTILVASSSYVVNPSLYAKNPYDPFKDFAPVSGLALLPLIMAINADLPFKSVQELIAGSKKTSLNFASSGNGGAPHMAAELFKSETGASITHVPYKGFAQAVIDAVACNVDLIFGAISTGIPHVKSGKLKAIAVTIPQRHPGLPDTPTFREAGHPGVAIEAYMGLLAPAGTPRPIIDKLHHEVVAILKEKDTIQRLTGAGLDIVGNTPDEFGARIKRDLEKFGKISRSLDARVQ